MKQKSTLKKVLTWLTDVGAKALVILLVVTAGFYAYAQVDWPSSDPNPVTGVVGMFVGESDGAYTTLISGYSDANDECVTAYTGSHICTTAEMTNSYNHGTGGSLSNIGVYWINSAAPGNISPAINDCNGWASNGSPFFGTVWSFENDSAGILPCFISTLSVSPKFACCQ